MSTKGVFLLQGDIGYIVKLQQYANTGKLFFPGKQLCIEYKSISSLGSTQIEYVALPK